MAGSLEVSTTFRSRQSDDWNRTCFYPGMLSISLPLLVWFWGRVTHAVYVLCGRNFLSSTARDVKTCFFRQKDLRLFLILFITRSLACFLDFKEWLCEVEHSGENDCMVKMLASIIAILPKTWCVLCRPYRSLSACPYRQPGTVLKFWDAEAGWICKGAHLRRGVWKLACLLEASLSRPSLLGSIRKLSQYCVCALGTRVKAKLSHPKLAVGSLVLW